MSARKYLLVPWYELAIAAAIVAALTLFTALSSRPANGATQSTGFKWEVGISGQVITNPVAATALTVPLGAQHAWITVKNNPACFNANMAEAPPTATSGGEWHVGTIRVENDRAYLQSLRFINCAEGATTIKVYYSRDRRIGD